MGDINWLQIRLEYETTNTSYRKIADKHGVSFPTLRDRAKREGWIKSKKETHDKIVTKTLQKTVTRIAEKESSRSVRILNISDKLADKIEEAVGQLENYIVTNKVKTKTITYDPDTKKPSKEVVVENEVKDIVSGIIDKHGLKQLTAALKDIKDLYPVEDDEPLELPDDGFMDAMKAGVKDIWADEVGSDSDNWEDK